MPYKKALTKKEDFLVVTGITMFILAACSFLLPESLDPTIRDLVLYSTIFLGSLMFFWYSLSRKIIPTSIAFTIVACLSGNSTACLISNLLS